MPSKPILPKGLAPEIAGPLVAAAERVAVLKPWLFMSDLHLIGLRDDISGELEVGSILGNLGEVFAVVVNRHARGLRWIAEIATTGEAPDHEETLENMDCVKVEWTVKRELNRTDLETLKAGGFKTPPKGPHWPRFQSCQPGWYPWPVSAEEAHRLVRQLGKVVRLVRLMQRFPELYQNHVPGEVPVVPGGEEDSLQAQELEWVPLIPPPLPSPEPVTLTEAEKGRLSKLPQRKEFVFELVAPLLPEMSFLDEKENRPCVARTPLLADRDSRFIFATELAHGAAPLHEALKPVLVKGLEAAQVRPGVLHVANERLEQALRPVCESLGVPVRQVDSLNAYEALYSLAGGVGKF